MGKIKTTLFLILAKVCTVCAVIIETPHFHHLPSHVDEETLVLLDIDDTLLIPSQMLGCDEWFQHQLKEHQKAGMSASNALKRTISEWEAIRHLTNMEIVEPGTEKIVQKLQEQNCFVMGLTTQGFALATRTVQQLKNHQLDLSLKAPSPESHCLLIDSQNVVFVDGVLFTSGSSKGKSLFALCDKIGYTPKRIVFINDKACHLRDIEQEAEKRQVEFIGLRYAFSDQRKKAFCPRIAHHQFTHSTFHRLLSDEEARASLGIE